MLSQLNRILPHSCFLLSYWNNIHYIEKWQLPQSKFLNIYISIILLSSITLYIEKLKRENVNWLTLAIWLWTWHSSVITGIVSIILLPLFFYQLIQQTCCIWSSFYLLSSTNRIITSMTDANIPDVAMAVARMDGYYVGHTCLTLPMAYQNARLLGRPVAGWLRQVVE